jgi:hypothetical protein
MTEIHIVDAIARTPECTTEAVWQYAYGLELRISGVTLPETFELQMCNEGDSETKTAVGQNGVVLIYDEYLETGKDIFCYLFLHDDETDGRTVRKITIPVKHREPPSDIEPTPVEQDVITQAIGALNRAVAQTAQDVESADASAESARADAESAQASATTAVESAQSAQASATASAQSADSASQSATSASQSATSASASAQSAERDADRAEMAVNNGAYLWFYIEAGKLYMDKTPTAPVDFYMQDGKLYVEEA